MNFIKRIIIFQLGIILLGLFYSCENSLHENIEGLWQIENLNFQNKNITNTLSLNTISFRENSGSVPRASKYHMDENIDWKVLESEKSDSIIIKSKNPVFNGKYRILFAKDEQNSIFAKLISDDTQIEIRKIDLGI